MFSWTKPGGRVKSISIWWRRRPAEEQLWPEQSEHVSHIEKHFISNCASISWRARLGLIFESVHISKVSKWTFFCSFVIQISILSVARSVLMNTPSERWSPNPVLWLHLWLRKIESNQLVIQRSGRRHLRSPRRAELGATTDRTEQIEYRADDYNSDNWSF